MGEALPLARGILVEDFQDMYIPQTESEVCDYRERPDMYGDYGSFEG